MDLRVIAVIAGFVVVYALVSRRLATTPIAIGASLRTSARAAPSDVTRQTVG